jgi:hypothetical protein
MPDRQSEPWESGAPGPFLTLEAAHGTVEVWALGSDHFTIKSPDREQLVVGFRDAQHTAITLAERLEHK